MDITINKNDSSKLLLFDELSQEEIVQLNGGLSMLDGITQAVFYAAGWATEKISDGFASARSGGSGAYIPNM